MYPDIISPQRTQGFTEKITVITFAEVTERMKLRDLRVLRGEKDLAAFSHKNQILRFAQDDAVRLVIFISLCALCVKK